MILLDTCTLLWLVDAPNRLSEAAKVELGNPANQIFVSAISAFEIGVKLRKGKLGLPLPVSDWFPQVCSRHGLAEVPITGAIAAGSTELPPLHMDPADRILVATAREHRLAILTPDPLISQYPGVKVVW
jgi:PIN domain nuclease of toxin-antitoxin system